MEIKIGSKLDELYCNGLRACQQEGIILCLDKLYEKIGSVSNIIEIGTSLGGFTELLRNSQISERVDEVNTFNLTKTDFKSNGIFQVVGNCFEVEHLIGGMILRPGRTLIFCDGGNKKKEFNVFSRYLKEGDIIFAHDYCTTKEEFDKSFRGKVWNYLELKYDNIKETVEELKLTPFMQEEFSLVMWASFIK